MQHYWLGLDAGGTGSTFVVVDAAANEIIRLTGGPIQARKMPVEDQLEAIAAYLEPVLRDLGTAEIAGFGLGIAGTGRPKERAALEQAMAARWPWLRAVVRPDSEAAHHGAFAGGDGVLVITGTGSIVWGRRGGEWFRAGGLGYLIGDEGSGMRLGMDGLAAAGHAWDGGTPTSLCQMLAERFSIETSAAMVTAVYDDGFQPSRFAVCVLEAAEAGDPPSQAIVLRQTELLSAQVALVADRFPSGDRKVVLWGGLQKNAYYKDAIGRAIEARIGNFKNMPPMHEPCIGATFMAQKEFS